MSNHLKGNWFVSVFRMHFMSSECLAEIEASGNYRETTRRNAKSALLRRKGASNWRFRNAEAIDEISSIRSQEDRK